MMYRTFDMFMMVVLVWFMFIPLLVFGVMTDKIDIEFNNDYLEKYSECQVELERTQPICPACQCRSETGMQKIIIGFLWGLIIMYLIMRYEVIGKIFKSKTKLTKNKRK